MNPSRAYCGRDVRCSSNCMNPSRDSGAAAPRQRQPPPCRLRAEGSVSVGQTSRQWVMKAPSGRYTRHLGCTEADQAEHLVCLGQKFGVWDRAGDGIHPGNACWLTAETSVPLSSQQLALQRYRVLDQIRFATAGAVVNLTTNPSRGVSCSLSE